MGVQYCEFIKSSIKFWDPLWIFSHKVDREKKRRPDGLLYWGTRSNCLPLLGSNHFYLVSPYLPKEFQRLITLFD